MVDTQIATSSVTDPRLLSAFRKVPREIFVPPERQTLAYSDAPHPLGGRRVLPPPAVFARLTQLADVNGTDRVLSCWCATGYSVAILADIAAEVVGLEPDAVLAEAARANLVRLDIANAALIHGDYSAVDLGRFDIIIIEGTMAIVPDALLNLLNPGGRLVCLVGQGPVGTAHIYTRTPQGVVTQTSFNASLPAVDIESRPDVFVF